MQVQIDLSDHILHALPGGWTITLDGLDIKDGSWGILHLTKYRDDKEMACISIVPKTWKDIKTYRVGSITIQEKKDLPVLEYTKLLQQIQNIFMTFPDLSLTDLIHRICEEIED